MARVPVYQQQVRTGQPQGGDVQVSGIGQGAAALGAGLEKAAEPFGAAAEKAAKDAREARLMDAYGRLGKERLDLESALKGVRGEAALGQDLPGIATQRLDEAAAKIEADLPDDVRPAFKRIQAQERLSLYNAAGDWYGKQADEFAASSYKGVLDVAGQKAALAATNLPVSAILPGAQVPSDVTEARHAVESAVATRAAQQGWSPGSPQYESLRQGALTDFHLQTVETLRSPTVDRAADAKAYLDAHRAEIDPLKAAAMDRELGPAALTDKARTIVNQVEQLPTQEAQAKAVLAIQDEHLAKRVSEIVAERRTLLKNAREDDQKAALGSTFNAIEKGVRTTEALERLPAFGQLDDTGQARAREHMRQLISADRSAKGQERAMAAEERRLQSEANLAAERDFLAKPVEERANADVTVLYGGRVGNIDGLNVIKARQQAAKKEWDKDRGVSEGEFLKLVKTEAQGLLTDKRDLDAFTAWVGKQRATWLGEKGNEGKEPPRETVNGWIAEGLTKRKGEWWGSDYGYELTDEERAGRTVLPPEEQPYKPPAARAGASGAPAAPAQGAAAPSAPGAVPALLARPPEASAAPAPAAPVTSVEQIPQKVRSTILEEWKRDHPKVLGGPSPRQVVVRYRLGLTRGEW